MVKPSTMDDTTMGFLYINESFSSPTEIKNLNTNHSSDLFFITFDANLQDFDVMNRNQRYYDGKNIWECIQSEKIQSLLRTGGWFGEFEHPFPMIAGEKLSPERIQNVPPQLRAFKIMQPHMVGNVLKAKIQSAQGEVGESFGKEVLAGWIPQFSVRAIAVMMMRNGKPYVMVKRLITYDAPWYPSHKIAEATSKPEVHSMSFMESTDITPMESAKANINDVMIPLAEILTEVGRTDVNTNVIMEAFDLPMENLCGFDAERKHVIIRDNDNMIYSDISPATVKKVNDFYRSF